MTCLTIFLKKCGRFGDTELGKWLNAMCRALIGHPRRSLEDSSAESYVDCGSLSQVVSERTILATWLEAVLAMIYLVKSAFCPHTKNLPEGKLKVMDQFLQQRRFQDSLILTLSFGYY